MSNGKVSFTFIKEKRMEENNDRNAPSPRPKWSYNFPKGNISERRAKLEENMSRREVRETSKLKIFSYPGQKLSMKKRRSQVI